MRFITRLIPTNSNWKPPKSIWTVYFLIDSNVYLNQPQDMPCYWLMFQESTKQENPGKVESATERRTTQRSGICVLIFLSILSNILSTEKLTLKKLCKFAELQFLTKKTPIFPNCQLPNGFYCITVNFIIQAIKY